MRKLPVVLALFGAAGLGQIAHWIPTWMVAQSVVSFLVFWADKSAAQVGRWRVPEVNLLGLSLAGSWPGALLAQHRLRHKTSKTSKTSFQLLFWLCVAANLTVVILLAGGQLSLENVLGAL